jgi:NAD+ kinase
MPKAAIISKPQKPELEQILPELTLWLTAHGFEYIFDPESAGYLNTTTDAAIERQFMPEQSP